MWQVQITVSLTNSFALTNFVNIIVGGQTADKAVNQLSQLYPLRWILTSEADSRQIDFDILQPRIRTRISHTKNEHYVVIE